MNLSYNLSMLSIISVKYGSSQWLEKNLELVAQLNPSHQPQWLIINNDNDPSFRSPHTILPAVAREQHHDKGSYHHAAAINSALPHVKTRFLLVLDHDFYIVQPNWIERITEHMLARDLAFFGSVWHPKWTYQYRYFPSVHCFLVDLEQVPIAYLDFLPAMGTNWLDNIISHPALPLPKNWRTRLQTGQFRDTGWQIYRRFKKRHFESLIPHLNAAAQHFIPERLSFIPTKPDSFTRASILAKDSSFAYQNGWEEFFWQNQPFAFHLRRVGRNPQTDEYHELSRLLALYQQTFP